MFPGKSNLATVDRLRQQCLQMADSIGNQAVVLSSEILMRSPGTSYSLSGVDCDGFVVLLSPSFSMILGWQTMADSQDCKLVITFTASEIEIFLADLQPSLPARHKWKSSLKKWQAQVKQMQPSSNDWQSQFTLQLIESLTPPTDAEITAVACEPIQLALNQQIDEEKLLYEVATHIRQSLDLPLILKNAIDRVQKYLQVDRLIIYQFQQEQLGDIAISTQRGRVAYESLLNSAISSVLNFQEAQACFDRNSKQWQKYEQGQIQSITDVSVAYSQHPEFSYQMQRFQVKSKLVVPIIVTDQLWGLLIAHACQHYCEWQSWQQDLLKKVSEHLSIAIYQAEIYTELQGQKATLEEHVEQRTRELRDALMVAQSASEAKTEFLAVLSHELRTPLTSILGLSYTLLNLLSSNLDARQKNYLQIIKHSGDHLLELIDDMLEMSKLEAGRAVLKVSDFSLVKLLQQVVQIIQQRADLRQISLQIQIMDGEEDISQDPTQDIHFCGDTKRIKQILINLLTNAIKFTAAAGQIVLRTWREFDYLVLQVEDTGIGIAQEQIPLIFQKFHQVDSTLDREYEGMGLGLALTKQLVELHGGWIEVESVEGNGSTFTVWLASQSLRPPKPEKLPRLAGSGEEKQPAKTIVLVEDNKETGGFVADILTAAGYQVVSLTETYLAHKQIELWQPDLVIIDQEIGQEPTDHILRYLHKLTQSQHIRYLLISTLDQPQSKEQVMDVEQLFWNRVKPEQLLNKIANII